jgi:hypothetical protein
MFFHTYSVGLFLISHDRVLTSNQDKFIPGTGLPTFINADNPTERLDKQELEGLVRKLGKGLQDVAGLKKGEVVLACAANSV